MLLEQHMSGPCCEAVWPCCWLLGLFRRADEYKTNSIPGRAGQAGMVGWEGRQYGWASGRYPSACAAAGLRIELLLFFVDCRCFPQWVCQRQHVLVAPNDGRRANDVA
jgi:hypothetical protein